MVFVIEKRKRQMTDTQFSTIATNPHDLDTFFKMYEEEIQGEFWTKIENAMIDMLSKNTDK